MPGLLLSFSSWPRQPRLRRINGQWLEQSRNRLLAAIYEACRGKLALSAGYKYSLWLRRAVAAGEVRQDGCFLSAMYNGEERGIVAEL